MDEKKVHDALDSLQLMVNDVLVQTGKALRASRKDDPGNIHAQGPAPTKMPDIIRSFHDALDVIEFDIIRAKSVFLRDIKELQEKRQATAPASQITDTKMMIINLETSAVVGLGDHLMVDTAEKKPVAPFPDMGLGLLDGAHDVAIKEEPMPAPTTTTAAIIDPVMKSESKPSPASAPPTAPMAPMPIMGGDSLSGDFSTNSNAPTNGSANMDQGTDQAELNFTDMQFTLAPTNESQNNPSGAQEKFDIATFAPADGGDDLLTLDNYLPQSSTEQPAPTAPAQAPVTVPTTSSTPTAPVAPPAPPQHGAAAKHEVHKTDEKMVDPSQDPIFDGLYVDSGQTDGLDFDFSVGEETFDTLMADRGNYLEHGDADASFFGLDNA